MTTDPWQQQREALGALIRTQRQLAHLSLRQLSELAKVSNPYLSQLERGLHEPSRRVLQGIADALGVPVETLLAQSGMTSPRPADSAEDATATAAAPAASGGTAPSPAAGDPEAAIRADSRLTPEQKEALLTVYRSYVAGSTQQHR